jgi:serine/threonine protein kinase
MGSCFTCCNTVSVSPGPVVKPDVPSSAEEEEEEGPSYYSFPEFFASSPTRELSGMRFEREIGKGAMSRVYLAINESTNQPVAVKIYNNAHLYKPVLGPEEPLYEQVQREVNLMVNIDHPYILPIQDVIPSRKTNSTFLVLPFAEKGTLQSLLDSKSISASELPICFYQIAEAFRYLHEQNIVHRDLKPDNVLCYQSGWFVLSDFSVSTQLDPANPKLDDTKGSPAFLSPEECSGDPYDPKAADVWAFGVCIYRSVFGFFPFNIESAHGRAVVATIIRVKELLESEDLVIPELPEGVEETVIEVLKATMEKKVEKRPTFEEVVLFEYFGPGKEAHERLCQKALESQNAG